MPEYMTRQACGFILTSGTIDPVRSPHHILFPEYPQKVAALSAAVGADRFLWAYEESRRLNRYEMSKPVEWIVEVPRERVIGYVADESWFAFLAGHSPSLGRCFSRVRPTGGEFSVLLPFPLLPSEPVRRRVYAIKNPHTASIVEDVDLRQHQ